MTRIKRAGIAAAVLIMILVTACGKNAGKESAGAGKTSDQASVEIADADLAQDSVQDEEDLSQKSASTDLFVEDGVVCTQFLALAQPGDWDGHVIYHYFQEPESGRYALDVVETESMTATEGVGGGVFSIAMYDTYPEERGMENSRYLGMLRNEEGKFLYVFLESFSGTRFTEGSEESYRTVESYADSLAEYLTGRGGYTFEAGKEPEGTDEEEEGEK